MTRLAIDIDDSEEYCGLQKARAMGIVGGKQAEKHEFPWIVSIQKKDTGHFCGGAILNADWILTAAHCVFEPGTMIPLSRRDLKEITIVTGMQSLNKKANKENVYTLDTVAWPANYEPNKNDIALLRTDRPIQMRYDNQMHYTVNRVCLPPYTPTNRVHYPPREAIAAGWGYTSFGGHVSNNLLKVTIPHVPLPKCRAIYGNFDSPVAKGSLCYGRRGRDSCQGDSGGPLIVDVDDKFHVVGVVSYGINCGEVPGVYTEVKHHLDWIHQTMAHFDAQK